MLGNMDWHSICPHCKGKVILPIQPSPVGWWVCPYCDKEIACWVSNTEFDIDSCASSITLVTGKLTDEMRNDERFSKFHHGRALKDR